eukprot:5049161-Amphidinium_carterae.1
MEHNLLDFWIAIWDLVGGTVVLEDGTIQHESPGAAQECALLPKKSNCTTAVLLIANLEDWLHLCDHF